MAGTNGLILELTRLSVEHIPLESQARKTLIDHVMASIKDKIALAEHLPLQSKESNCNFNICHDFFLNFEFDHFTDSY